MTSNCEIVQVTVWLVILWSDLDISSLASVISEPVRQHSTMTDLSSYRMNMKLVSVLVSSHSSGVELLLGPGLCHFLSNFLLD